MTGHGTHYIALLALGNATEANPPLSVFSTSVDTLLHNNIRTDSH